LKAAKIDDSCVKMSRQCFQNLNQVNLLVEFKIKIIKSEINNCGYTCQNIFDYLLFKCMNLNYFYIITSKYWKSSKIWVMSKLKNPTLNSISVWVHHFKSQHSVNWEEKSVFSVFILLDLPGGFINFLSSTVHTTQLLLLAN